MPRRPNRHSQSNQPKKPRNATHRSPSRSKLSGLIFFGRHAVFAALENPKRTIHKVFTTSTLAEEVRARRPSVDLEIEEPDALSGRIASGTVHQNILASVAPLSQPALETVLDAPRNGPLLVLDQVTDPQNIGAIFRSAAAFGAAAVITQDRNVPGETGALARAASGGLELVPWVQVTNLSRALGLIAEAGYWRVGLDGSANQTLATAMPDAKLCLVLGAEGRGMRHNTAKHCDLLAKLPIAPDMESLNVSNAAAVALYIAKAQVEK